MLAYFETMRDGLIHLDTSDPAYPDNANQEEY